MPPHQILSPLKTIGRPQAAPLGEGVMGEAQGVAVTGRPLTATLHLAFRAPSGDVLTSQARPPVPATTDPAPRTQPSGRRVTGLGCDPNL